MREALLAKYRAPAGPEVGRVRVRVLGAATVECAVRAGREPCNVFDCKVARGAQTKCFLYGAPKNHDHYGLSRFCMDKHE
jgi:hypothetical protein